MTDRGKDSAIRDPAIAIAVAKCWLARTHNLQSLGAFHPGECGFCEMPLGMMMSALLEFGEWSGLSFQTRVHDVSHPVAQPWNYEVESFRKLDPAEQRRKVAEAQGYIEEEG